MKVGLLRGTTLHFAYLMETEMEKLVQGMLLKFQKKFLRLIAVLSQRPTVHLPALTCVTVL